MLTRFVDWCIEDEYGDTLTDYEKWEYREKVLRGMGRYASAITSAICFAVAVISLVILLGE